MAFKKKNILILIPLALIMASCSWGPPYIDLTQPDFPIQGANVYDPSKLLVTADPTVRGKSNFESRTNYHLFYALGGTEVPYVQAVSNQLTGSIPESGNTDSAGKTVLSLTSLTHNAFLHDGSDLPVVTEEIVAEWNLTSPDGTLIETFSFLGQATGDTEWGISALPKSVHVRAMAALMNLYQETINGLTASAKLENSKGN